MRRFLIPFVTVAITACEAPPPPAPPAPPVQRDAAGSRFDPSRVVARAGSLEITYADVIAADGPRFEQARAEYLRQLFLLERSALEKAIDESLLADAGKREGHPNADAFVQSLESKLPPISDDEVRKFFAERLEEKGKSIDGENFEALRSHMTISRSRAFRQQLAGQIRAQAGVRTDLPPPAVPHANIDTEGRPFRGNAQAAVTIIEFGDFECPACIKAFPKLRAIFDTHADRVRMAFFHVPIPAHTNARAAAVFAECAKAQGKFWEAHDAMFEAGGKLVEEKLIAIATKLGLDTAKLDACRKDPATDARVAKDIAFADTLKVDSTPTIFINGVRSSVPDLNDLSAFAMGFGQ